jgi:lysozyme
MSAAFLKTGLRRALALALLVATSVTGARVSSAQSASSYAQGIDVSQYQGTIDWSQVAGAGISFAIARVSDGLNYPDPYFAQNWSGMQANGIIRGVYQYFEPGQDAVQQADLLINATTFQQGDLPPFLDFETTGGLDASALSSQIALWCNEIESRTGLTPIIYCSWGFWNGLGSMQIPAGVQLWVANWGVSAPSLPTGWNNWVFWQWADTTTVPGVGSADADVFNGTVAQLQAFAGASGSVAPSGGTVATSTPSAPAASSSASYPMIGYGSTGYYVQVAQTYLQNLGYYQGNVDGIFGPMTLQAVESFQYYNGLSVDGIVGPMTWGVLTQ